MMMGKISSVDRYLKENEVSSIKFFDPCCSEN